jgi:hypothetical protein
MVAGCSDTDYDDLMIEWYCGYGAVSRAQFNGCVEHVTVEDVERSAAQGRGAGEWAVYCRDNYVEPEGDAGVVRECNSVRYPRRGER